jgi:hypothetical protein
MATHRPRAGSSQLGPKRVQRELANGDRAGRSAGGARRRAGADCHMIRLPSRDYGYVRMYAPDETQRAEPKL